MDFLGRWDVIVGVLTIAGITIGFLKFINRQLPSKRLPVMFDLLDDTDAFLLSCCEEGLIHEDQAIWFQDRLKNLRGTAEDTRLEVHSAKTYSEDFRNFLKGLTWDINYVCRNVKEVRSVISTNSKRERERRAAQERARRDATDTGRVTDRGDAEEGTPVDSAAASEGPRHVQPLVPAATLVAVSAVTCNAEDVRPAGTHGEVLQASGNAMQILDRSTEALSDGGRLSDASAALSSRSILVETKPKWRKLFSSEQRLSACSSSSGSSSARGLLCKKSGSSRSRTRIFARFVRKTRSQHSALYLADMQKFPTAQAIEDNDEEWEDELSVCVAV